MFRACVNQANGLRFRCSPRMNSKLNGTLQGLVCKLDETAGAEKMSQVHYCWSQIGFRRVDTECKCEANILQQTLYAAQNGVMRACEASSAERTQFGELKLRLANAKKSGVNSFTPITQRFANLQFTE